MTTSIAPSAMYKVLSALLPGIAVLSWQLGGGILINLLLASATAISSEALLLRCRGVAVRPFLSDGSALVTAWLLALALPPYLPWWITVISVTAAIVIGKQVYGGLGNNLFNPAMVGYAIAIVAFPLSMTAWPGTDLLAQRFDWITVLTMIFIPATDVLSGATPLSAWRINASATTATISWHWINLAFLVGGLWLWHQKIISWRIPLAMLLAVAGGATMMYWFDNTYPSAVFHLSNGAIMLGAFFIATDPVTAPKSAVAQGIFGGGIGLLLLTFRTSGSYIDGLAFAVLIMNMLTPLLNRYFKE